MEQGMLAFALPARFEAWVQYHRENPGVYDLFVIYAEQARKAVSHSSARLLGERIRWEVMIQTRSTDGFKLNNNHLPYYSRLLMATRADEFEGFFQRRDERFDATDSMIVAADAIIQRARDDV